MIPVTVATVVVPDGFAPIDVVVVAGVDDNPRHPYIYLSPSRRRDKCSSSTESKASSQKNGTHELISSNVV